MSRLLVRWRTLRFSAIAVVWWVSLAALAWGQTKPAVAKGAESPPAYVPSYALVVFCIGAALAILLASAKRRDRAKPEAYGENK